MLLSIFILSFLPFAEEIKVNLSLRECLAKALENNLEIKIKYYEPQIAELEITKQEAKFDPIFSFQANYDDYEKEKFLKTTSGDGIDVGVSTSLYKKFFTGTSLQLSYQTGYERYYDADDIFGFKGTDTFWNQEVYIKVTQPLLRNFGVNVNTAPIQMAETQNKIQQYEMQQQILATITETRFLFLNLVEVYESLKFQKQSLKFAENFFQMTQQSIDSGIMPPANLIEAKRIIAERKQNVIEAQKKMFLVGNKLKKLIFPLDEISYKKKLIIPNSSILFEKYNVDFDNSLEKALRNRLDLLTGELHLENENISVSFYKNQMLPKLDVSASIGIQGLNEEWSQTYDSVSQADFPTWKIMLSLEIPIGNREAKTKYEQAKLKRLQVQEKLNKIKNQIMFDIQEAIIYVKAEEAKVIAAQQSYRLAMQQLKNQQLKYEEGMIPLFQLQDTEQKLTKARIEKVKAMIAHEQAIANLQYGEGDVQEIMRYFTLNLDSLLSRK